MSNTCITVKRWTAEGDEPDVSTFSQGSDGTWQEASEPTAPPRSLEDIMLVDPDGALHVETTGDAPAPSVLAAALPQSSEYLKWVDEIETDDEVLDQYIGLGVVQVAIDGRRWAPFALRSDQPNAIVWLECDSDELTDYRAVPAGKTIAWASGIENDSMTSGTFAWSLIDVGAGYVCFAADPDDDSNTYIVEERQGRTNRELAQVFVGWVDWEPVSNAVVRAIELGGSFEGVASELDDEWSDSCEIRASVDLT